jgi:uncharacterized flavoprotein (TIGR03862 family)
MTPRVAIIGAGPAGLMAADVISRAGMGVDVYDAMSSPGRKFLRAGVGGLNLTHAEPFDDFVARYAERSVPVGRWLTHFSPAQVRDWAQQLGIDTFVGSSGRVFPVQMKAAPLLRAWLNRLHAQGVRLHLRHRWLGWDAAHHLEFVTPHGPLKVGADGTAATVLALGGGSWARLGADGRWLEIMAKAGFAVTPLKPSNCGFEVAWSAHLREQFSGVPLKGIAASVCHGDKQSTLRSGECVITKHGLEGGVIYALSTLLREQIARTGGAILKIDLSPQRPLERLIADLSRPRGRDSLAKHLRRCANIDGVKAALIHEFATPVQLDNTAALATLIKSLPVPLIAPRPIDEAISTAGGVRLEALDDALMLVKRPGVFCAGEMLDWEAPTGGYLLTACLASGATAGRGVLSHLGRQADSPDSS